MRPIGNVDRLASSIHPTINRAAKLTIAENPAAPCRSFDDIATAEIYRLASLIFVVRSVFFGVVEVKDAV